MKSLIIAITMLTCLVMADDNLRHRELGNEVMCLDLGKRKGKHNMKVTKKKYFKKLIRKQDAHGGECTEPTKKLSTRLAQNLEFCKNWNKDHVTIIAPKGMRKWLIEEVGATKGGCGDIEDNTVEIFE